MYPDILPRDLSPGLETYYVIATLLVVFLAIVSVWGPFIHLIRELNTILVRTIFYLQREFLGCKYSCLFTRLEDFFLSQFTLSAIALSVILLALYLAADDVIQFAKSCLCRLPKATLWQRLKQKIGWD